MTSLASGQCPVCHKIQRITLQGVLYRHEPPAGHGLCCNGSGKLPALPEEPVAAPLLASPPLVAVHLHIRAGTEHRDEDLEVDGHVAALFNDLLLLEAVAFKIEADIVFTYTRIQKQEEN